MILAAPIWEHERLTRDPHLAFVIMPFGLPWSTEAYRRLIRPAVTARGLRAVRADEMTGRNVLHDLWRGIYAARVIVAELTGPNPNVFYELGIAHTLGKKAILLTQDIASVPFDLRQQRLIVYSPDPEGYAAARAELDQHLAAILAEPVDELYHVRSPVGGFFVEAASLRLTLDERGRNAEIVDEMSVVGTRENVVLVNKIIEHSGALTGMSCNHRFVRSSQYPDLVRVAALFDPPYLQVGAHLTVVFSYRIEGGFEGDDRRWDYDIAVETERLDLELRAPPGVRLRVRLAEHVRPTDNDLQVLVPSVEEGMQVFRAAVKSPEVGRRYSLVWY